MRFAKCVRTSKWAYRATGRRDCPPGAVAAVTTWVSQRVHTQSQPAFAHSGSLKPSCSSLTLIDSILCECFKCWLAGNEAIIMQNAARKPLQIIRDARPSLCIGNEATRGQRASAHAYLHTYMHTNILDTLASSSITINGNPINLDTDYWQLFSRPARRTALQRNGQMIGQSTRVDSKPTRTSAVGH